MRHAERAAAHRHLAPVIRLGHKAIRQRDIRLVSSLRLGVEPVCRCDVCACVGGRGGAGGLMGRGRPHQAACGVGDQCTPGHPLQPWQALATASRNQYAIVRGVGILQQASYSLCPPGSVRPEHHDGAVAVGRAGVPVARWVAADRPAIAPHSIVPKWVSSCTRASSAKAGATMGIPELRDVARVCVQARRSKT